MESAVRGVVDCYKYGETGTTWLTQKDRAAKDITKNVKDAYDIMSSEMWI